MGWREKLKSIFVFGNRKIVANIGAINARDRKNIGLGNTIIKVSLLNEKDRGEKSVGIEIVYKGIGYYQTSPVVLSKKETQELIELLTAAVGSTI